VRDQNFSRHEPHYCTLRAPPVAAI